MPYTSGIGFRSWHADHPSFKRLGAGTPSRFALVFTSAIERVPKQNRPILSRACPRVSERILAKKRVSEFPNIAGISLLAGFVTPQSGDICGTGPFSNMKRWVQNFVVIDGSDSSVLEFDASLANAQYGSAETVQPASIRALALIRAY